MKDLKNNIDKVFENLDLSNKSKDELRKKANNYDKKKKSIFKYLSIVATAAIFIFLIFSNFFYTKPLIVEAKDLMQSITPNKVNSIDIDQNYIDSFSNFSFQLFKNASITNKSSNKNTLISPLTAYLSLAMISNGANETSLKEFENILGSNNLKLDVINNNSYSLINKYSKFDKYFSLTNSIWFDSNIGDINKDFLQKNADFYSADAFKTNFVTNESKTDIKNWIKKYSKQDINLDLSLNTNALILNSTFIEDSWDELYDHSKTHSDTFFASDNSNITCEFLGFEKNEYLKSEYGVGFSNKLKNLNMSFIAFMPNEPLDTFVKKIDYNIFKTILESKYKEDITLRIPKFSFKDTTLLNSTLQNLGLRKAFTPGNLNKINDGIFIGKVINQNFIQIDEQGLKAGSTNSAELRKQALSKYLKINKPFLIFIVDNEIQIPLYIGAVTNPMVHN